MNQFIIIVIVSLFWGVSIKLTINFIIAKRDRLRNTILKEEITHEINAYEFGVKLLSENNQEDVIIKESYENVFKHEENTIHLTTDKIYSKDICSILIVIHEIGHAVHINRLKEKENFKNYLSNTGTLIILFLSVFFTFSSSIFMSNETAIFSLYSFFLLAKMLQYSFLTRLEIDANKFVNLYLKNTNTFTEKEKRYMHKFKSLSFLTYIVSLCFPLGIYIHLIVLSYYL